MWCSSVVILVLFFCEVAYCRYFTIVGPRTRQHLNDYSVHLTYINPNAEDGLKITASLQGVDSNEEIDEISLFLSNNEEKNITFELNEHPNVQDMILKITSDVDNFEQSVKIHTIDKRYSVFIQTDKAIYKPEDKVLFRVLVIDAETKPYEFIRMSINITDAAGNIVDKKEINSHEETVFEDKYEISDDPFQGDWKISVQIDEDPKVTTHTFNVDEYVLPRFEVFADTKTHVTLAEQDLKFNIYAKYTFGEYVKGKATMTTKVFDSKFPEKIVKEKKFEINDISMKKYFKVNLSKDLTVMHAIRDMIVEVTTEFQEELTKKWMHKNETITISRDGNFIIQVERPQKRLKPGFPYEFKVSVRNPDGSLDVSTRVPIKVKAHFHYSKEKCAPLDDSEAVIEGFEKNMEKNLEKGQSNFILDVPTNASAMILTVKYFETVKIYNITRFPAKTREYLKITMKIKGNSVDDKVTLQVESSLELSVLYYVIVGRTGIVETKYSEYSSGKYVADIKFKVTTWMIPEAQVLVYYIHHTGEIVYDYFTIHFDNHLPNKLEIIPDTQKSQPGKNIKLKLKSTHKSTVYLLGVDRSVNLLKTGNDIEQTRVMDDLQSYNAFKTFGKLEIEGRDDVDDDRYLDVGDSNLFMITNAFDGRVDCLKERSKGLNLSPNEADDISLLETGDDLDEFESKIRKEFPETWIFEKRVVDDEDGIIEYENILPDTITSWDITGFTLSSSTGLGIAKPTSITVSQMFFLDVHLPYSIRVGEILRVDVTVFSYITKPKTPLEVDVTLYSKKEPIISENDDDNNEEDETAIELDDLETLNDDDVENEFEFYTASSKNQNCKYTRAEQENVAQKSTKRIKVASKSGSATHFFIKASKAGKRTIRIRAQVVKSQKTHDEVIRKLKVEHEGVTEYRNHAYLIDLRDKERTSHAFDIQISPETVKNSIKMAASAIGDLVGPALYSTQNLIQIPAGCWEQRLKAFVPTIAAIDYLNATKKLTPEKRKLGEDALRAGVQQTVETRITSGERKGAFSIWTLRHSSHSDSIWLTSYVLKCFGKAKHLISVDDKYLYDGLEFLSKMQEPSGKWPEYGRIAYYNLQTDSSEGIPLTAFTVIAFLENQPYIEKFKEKIDKSLNYIDSHASELKDNYALAIAAYALALGKHISAKTTLETLRDKAIREGDETMYWEKDMLQNKNTGNTVEGTKIEIAAYAILAHVHLEKSEDALPIVNWLVSRRNSGGGFSSTHDSVIALQALAEIATKLYSDQLDMNIKLEFDKSPKVEFHFDQKSGIKPKVKQIHPMVRYVSLTANGKGISSVQVAYNFKRNIKMDLENSFNLDLTVNPSVGVNILHVTACAKFIPNEESKQTGMAIVEVTLPSGYVVDPDFDILRVANIKKYELKQDKTLVVLYFDFIDANGVCPQVQAIRQKRVDLLKKAPVKVYDYYNPEKRSTDYYFPAHMQEC